MAESAAHNARQLPPALQPPADLVLGLAHRSPKYLPCRQAGLELLLSASTGLGSRQPMLS